MFQTVHYREIVGEERKNRENQMENTPSCPRSVNVNLKNLPPIHNPCVGNANHSSIPAKFEKSRYIGRVPQFMPPNHSPDVRPNEYDGVPMNPACFDSARSPNARTTPKERKENFGDSASRSSGCSHDSTKEVKKSAKSLLYEICTANHWKPPLFECCEEEGPSHAKKYTFKVIVEMKGDCGEDLECYGKPQTRKKVAAEDAAEGAVWYLKHLGYGI
ncbi:ribonuclease 3-like protein 1 isoform X2 [Cucurbita moschata]|uniref:Ribonuclease 3-like protein 1 isoform X2 n=1 Tax=Cucurbita moschata TaxID=3662 RepID=A0A6J1GVX2_CUCMO|nr:ribonuclease 3-like protein 1 isoform X2 [Cucurbita moschata]